MKFVSGDGTRLHYLELSRRNLEGLLEKLDDPHSARTLIDGTHQIEVHAIVGDEGEALAVRAVEDSEHYSDRPPGEMYTNGKFK